MRTADYYNAGILAKHKKMEQNNRVSISNSNIVFVLLDIFTTLAKRQEKYQILIICFIK